MKNKTLKLISARVKRNRTEKIINQKAKREIKKWVLRKGYLDRDKGLEETAVEFGLAPEQLAHFCSSVLGEPFLSLRKRLRIEEAKRILKNEPDTPYAVAGARAGIWNKSNFRTQFREMTGMSPAEFRRYNSSPKLKRIIRKLNVRHFIRHTSFWRCNP